MVKTNSDMSSVNKFDGAKSLEDVIWTLVTFLSRNWPCIQFSRMKDSSIEDDRLWLTKEMSDTMLVVLLTTCKQGFYFVCIKEAYIRWLCPLKRNSRIRVTNEICLNSDRRQSAVNIARNHWLLIRWMLGQHGCCIKMWETLVDACSFNVNHRTLSLLLLFWCHGWDA